MKFSLLAAAASLLAVSEAVWPEPTKMTTGSSVVWISPDVQITYKPLAKRDLSDVHSRAASADATRLVNGAIGRFKGTLTRSAYDPWRFNPKGSNYAPSQGYSATSVKAITVQQTKGNASDESYTLSLGKDGSTTISAPGAVGAMHGLTTLSQLFYQTPEGGKYYTKLAPVAISDAPTYRWRGLNVDIARNYESPANIKRLVDALAFNKFSRLHIHATDSQSWPLEIPAIPALASKGAYAPQLVWSAAALRDVQQYALDRGIQTVIEIDSPGHTASIHWSSPDLIVGYNTQPWGPYCNEPPCGQLKLNNKAASDYFKKIYSDLLPRVKAFSGYFHSGGDEINANTYGLPGGGPGSAEPTKIQPQLSAFMKGLHSQITASSLQQVVWEEMVLQWNITLPTASTLVQTWQPGSLPAALAKGYRSLFGDYNYWYLDCGYGQWIDRNASNPDTPILPPFTDYCSPQKSWRQIYAYEPAQNVTDKAQLALIEGGEAHMWGELTDQVNFDDKVWPRASAAGEVLWSGPKGVAGVDESVTRRLADMRERLVGLGFAPQMVQMTWCLQNEGSCSL